MTIELDQFSDPSMVVSFNDLTLGELWVYLNMYCAAHLQYLSIDDDTKSQLIAQKNLTLGSVLQTDNHLTKLIKALATLAGLDMAARTMARLGPNPILTAADTLLSLFSSMPTSTTMAYTMSHVNWIRHTRSLNIHGLAPSMVKSLYLSMSLNRDMVRMSIEHTTEARKLAKYMFEDMDYFVNDRNIILQHIWDSEDESHPEFEGAFFQDMDILHSMYVYENVSTGFVPKEEMMRGSLHSKAEQELERHPLHSTSFKASSIDFNIIINMLQRNLICVRRSRFVPEVIMAMPRNQLAQLRDHHFIWLQDTISNLDWIDLETRAQEEEDERAELADMESDEEREMRHRRGEYSEEELDGGEDPMMEGGAVTPQRKGYLTLFANDNLLNSEKFLELQDSLTKDEKAYLLNVVETNVPYGRRLGTDADLEKKALHDRSIKAIKSLRTIAAAPAPAFAAPAPPLSPAPRVRAQAVEPPPAPARRRSVVAPPPAPAAAPRTAAEPGPVSRLFSAVFGGPLTPEQQQEQRQRQAAAHALTQQLAKERTDRLRREAQEAAAAAERERAQRPPALTGSLARAQAAIQQAQAAQAQAAPPTAAERLQSLFEGFVQTLGTVGTGAAAAAAAVGTAAAAVGAATAAVGAAVGTAAAAVGTATAAVGLGPPLEGELSPENQAVYNLALTLNKGNTEFLSYLKNVLIAEQDERTYDDEAPITEQERIINQRAYDVAVGMKLGPDALQQLRSDLYLPSAPYSGEERRINLAAYEVARGMGFSAEYLRNLKADLNL